MHVIATAGHVDHGKSTLVRQLTGTDPDRWPEEHRRGMTLDLGFAWTTLPDGCTLAFVDVPGHERFVPTMLAGIGPAPAVLFVVAADEGWMPQSTEHLDALAALGVRHGLLVVTRCDLADPEPATAQAVSRLNGTSLADVPIVRVSGKTGAGRDQLRAALDDLVHRLPGPDTGADVRLWIDRAFTIRGAGTVITGTLQAGTLHAGDELRLHSTGTPVTVRGLHRLGVADTEVGAVARVAVNLRGVSLDALRRGDALLTPGRWLHTDVVDVRLRGSEATELPRQLMLHIGSASTTARVRPLGDDTARLSLHTPLPLRMGDRALLRDPGSRRIHAGMTVLDVRPPELTRRGAARQRARELATRTDQPDGAAELTRRQVVRTDDLRAMGAACPADAVSADGWLLDETYRHELGARLVALVDDHHRRYPLEAGIAPEAARRALDLPDPALLNPVLRTPVAEGITLHAGRLRRTAPEFPDATRHSLNTLRAELERQPFHAPTADRLAELGLGEPELAAAARTGELLRLAPGLVLLPDAEREALDLLTRLPAPFTVSQVRRLLGTSRRVAVPLLELLVREGHTERLADGSHQWRR